MRLNERPELVVADLGAGLYRIECTDCGQTRTASGDAGAVIAVKTEHRCGGIEWHLAADKNWSRAIGG